MLVKTLDNSILMLEKFAKILKKLKEINQSSFTNLYAGCNFNLLIVRLCIGDTNLVANYL